MSIADLSQRAHTSLCLFQQFLTTQSYSGSGNKVLLPLSLPPAPYCQFPWESSQKTKGTRSPRPLQSMFACIVVSELTEMPQWAGLPWLLQVSSLANYKYTQQWHIYAVLPEDLNSVTSTHIRQLTTTCNSSYRGSITHSLGSHEHLQPCTHTERQADRHTSFC